MNPSIRSSRESEASKDREEPATSEAQQSTNISLEDIEIGAFV